MARFAAFLRGVMPTNAKMDAIRAAFLAAGFTDVKTVLASGNVVFTARTSAEATLERRAETALAEHLGRSFPTIVRPMAHLQALLATDPYAAHRVPAAAKRVVTFLRHEPTTEVELPVELDDARILARAGREVFTAYEVTARARAKGPVFMMLIERTFGKDVTTRTWDTIAKVVRAS